MVGEALLEMKWMMYETDGYLRVQRSERRKKREIF